MCAFLYERDASTEKSEGTLIFEKVWSDSCAHIFSFYRRENTDSEWEGDLLEVPLVGQSWGLGLPFEPPGSRERPFAGTVGAEAAATGGWDWGVLGLCFCSPSDAPGLREPVPG